ncbi:MAG: prepilin-type N-terminal cleavage/methylation domain-containing protein [Kiritimatiellaceae bacterium]|nr:prepilin-type N-terminal cleavage/methylation domain-containing protein [Kiritimatiellaceae bacterium]
MKKTNKKGFTLVEIMIVVAIIGLLAAIGIPSILGAYSNAQQKTKARNVADVEKAKGQLTLPAGTVTGSMGADNSTAITTGSTGASNILAILRISSLTDLNVGSDTITIGTMTTKASY